MMKNVKDYYDNTAADWSEEFLNEKKQSEILTKFYDCFYDGGTTKPRILDLGCGAGYDAKILSKCGAKVLGIDISENLIQIAKKNVPECRFLVGDARDSLARLGRFEGIVCLATLIHIEPIDMQKTLKNMADVLKKGGLLLVSVCDGIGRDLDKSLVQIDGEDYDKDFNCYNSTEICSFAYPHLKLVDTWRFNDFDEGWRYYVFMKV